MLQFMNIFQKGADLLYKKGPSPLEQMLEEASNEEIWQVPNSQLQEIADKTYSEVIMDFIWKKLNQAGIAIRGTEKTLILLDYLVKNGAFRCYSEAKLEVNTVRRLVDFVWTENGVEKGKQIRDRAETLAKLLADDRRIEFERENARKLKEQMKTLSYSNASLPSHLRPTHDYRESRRDEKGGLNAIEEFWAEGKKILRSQFGGNQAEEEEQRAREEIQNGDGEYDLETLPEIVQQQEKEWPQTRTTQKTTYEPKKTSSPMRDDRKEVFDKYAQEIFNDSPTDANGFGGFIKTKSEVQAETAKEVKKKWEKMESNFLELPSKQEDVNTISPQSDFSDFSAYSSTKEPHRRPRIFDDKEVGTKPTPVFEEWWDNPKNKEASSLRKENFSPSYPSGKGNKLYAENPAYLGRDVNAGTLAETKPNPPDWLTSNPFEARAGDNLMDY